MKITLFHPGLPGGLVVQDESVIVELQQRGLIEGNEIAGYKITQLGFEFWDERRLAKLRATEKLH